VVQRAWVSSYVEVGPLSNGGFSGYDVQMIFGTNKYQKIFSSLFLGLNQTKKTKDFPENVPN
jgi:hypothetical protein